MKHLGPLLAILLLAAGLRLYHLDSQSLWNDEGTSVALAQRNLPTIARDAAQDIHPPLYYWLLAGWVRLFGTSETAVRSLSALLGVALVVLTYTLGRRLAGEWSGLAAALLAAFHPFQVYYSQEARMYMLAAVLAAGAVLVLTLFICRQRIGSTPQPSRFGRSQPQPEDRRARRQTVLAPLVALVFLETAGLYTHYSFAFVVLILNVAYALWPALGLALSFKRPAHPDSQPRQPGSPSRTPPLGRPTALWSVSQLTVFLLYLPWLPTALRQLTTWPSPEGQVRSLPALADIWRWLILGPTIGAAQATVPLFLAALLAVAGVAWCGTRLGLAERASQEEKRVLAWKAALLSTWLMVPVVLVFALGLFREAYLKFLLVATPAACVLLGTAFGRGGRWAAAQVHKTMQNETAGRLARFAACGGFIACFGVLATASVLALHNYYTDPAYARDDYRAMTAYLAAVGRQGDAILLNAPGQQEVFDYYYHGGLPVYPLPGQRPLDPGETESALGQLAQPGGRVFAVLWATGESDPERFIEGWLDFHTFKALDTWYGNVRLAAYAVPSRIPEAPDRAVMISLGNDSMDQITLTGYSLLSDRLPAGDIAQVTLFWQAKQTPSRRYRAFLHLLDTGNHIVGQRDADPGGGGRPVSEWLPGESVADHFGVPVHPATPPGEYRLEVGLYDAETGRRLETADGSGEIWLDPIWVDRPEAAPPIAALGMEHSRRHSFGEVVLLGYDAHKLGFAHQPDAPLRPGDFLHLNLYWLAQEAPNGEWQVTVGWDGPGGAAQLAFRGDPVPGYPTSRWHAGDVWRGQFDLPIPPDMSPGSYRLRVETNTPGEVPARPFLSEPIRVSP